MIGERVSVGEPVVTSSGDGIFPKGLPIGTVAEVSRGPVFLRIRVKPAADLDRLDEVLVITQMQTQLAVGANSAVVRAADILAQRLPGLKQQPAPTATPAAPAAEKKSAPLSAANQKTAAGGDKKPAPIEPKNSPASLIKPKSAPAVSAIAAPSKKPAEAPSNDASPVEKTTP